MTILSYRSDTQLAPGSPGFTAVCPVLLCEYLTPGRVAPLGNKTELSLKPGVIYKAFTGIGFDPPVSPANIAVRATETSWKSGLLCCRVDFDLSGEMVVYFTVETGMEFVRSNPLFEVTLIGYASTPLNEVAGHVAKAVAPEGVRVATAGEKHLVGHREKTPDNTDENTVSEEAKVRAWLNEPDPRGAILDHGEEVARAFSVSPRVHLVTDPSAESTQKICPSDLSLAPVAADEKGPSAPEEVSLDLLPNELPAATPEDTSTGDLPSKSVDMFNL